MSNFLFYNVHNKNSIFPFSKPKISSEDPSYFFRVFRVMCLLWFGRHLSAPQRTAGGKESTQAWGGQTYAQALYPPNITVKLATSLQLSKPWFLPLKMGVDTTHYFNSWGEGVVRNIHSFTHSTILIKRLRVPNTVHRSLVNTTDMVGSW